MAVGLLQKMQYLRIDDETEYSGGSEKHERYHHPTAQLGKMFHQSHSLWAWLLYMLDSFYDGHSLPLSYPVEYTYAVTGGILNVVQHKGQQRCHIS